MFDHDTNMSKQALTPSEITPGLPEEIYANEEHCHDF